MSTATHYGPMTIERHRKLSLTGTHLHVYVDGVDVTNLCRYFDDRPGKRRLAHLYRVDAEGKKYLEDSPVGGGQRVATRYVREFEVRDGEPFGFEA